MKAWQLITHNASSPTYRKLKAKLSPDETDLVGSFLPTEQVMLAWERTLDVAKALRARVVLFQCPASFLPEPENLANLRRFFLNAPRGSFRLAWEPRGNWPSDLVRSLCQDLDLLRCVDPFIADYLTAKAPYWRLHGRGGYSYRYSDDDLAALLPFLQKGSEPPEYVFLNNIWMKDDALRLKRLMESE